MLLAVRINSNGHDPVSVDCGSVVVVRVLDYGLYICDHYLWFGRLCWQNKDHFSFTLFVCSIIILPVYVRLEGPLTGRVVSAVLSRVPKRTRRVSPVLVGNQGYARKGLGRSAVVAMWAGLTSCGRGSLRSSVRKRMLHFGGR